MSVDLNTVNGSIDFMRQLGASYKRYGLNGIPANELDGYHKPSMMLESSGNHRNHVPANTGTAAGWFGITAPTWETLLKQNKSLKPDGRLIPEQHVIAHFDLSYSNREKLIAAFGKTPDFAQWRAAHMLGAGGIGAKPGTAGIGAIEVIKEAEERPNTPIKGFLSNDKIEKNKNVKLKLKNGNDLYFPDFAVGDLMNLFYSQMKMPEKYQTNSVGSYKRDKSGLPEFSGKMVMMAGAIGLLALAVYEIGSWIFGGDDAEAKTPPPTPRRTPPRSRA